MTNWALLAMAGKRTKARKAQILGPLRAAVEKESKQGLDGITFASRVAESEAGEAGLSWRDFVKVKPSNCAGYTAADVRGIIAGIKAVEVALGADDEEEWEVDDLGEEGVLE